MSRHCKTPITVLLIALTALTGCHPTQPFYFHEDGDLSHYLDQATEIEYPDVCTTPLPDALASKDPLTISNPAFDEIWDVTLEECIIIALQNSKAMRNLGAVTPFGFADALVGRSGNTTVYDPAISETTASSRPQAFGPGLSGLSSRSPRALASQAGGVESALSEFDAWFEMIGTSGGQLLARSDRPQNFPQTTGFTFARINDSVTGGLTTQLTKKTPSGAMFTLSNQTNYDRDNNPLNQTFRKLSSIWTTAFEARVDMPLLRGRGTQINRIPIVLARINTDISLVQFEAAVRNLVLDVENTYWDLHNAYRTLETAKIGRDSAQVTWKIVYEKWKGDVSPVQDEAQAREQYFAFRSAVETALQTLYETESKLRYLMGLAATDGRLIRPIDEPTMAKVEFDWCGVRTETLVRSPELRGQKWAVKQRELELISAKNQLLPRLDVGLFYRWVGVGDQLIKANRTGSRFTDPPPGNGTGSTAFQELTSGDYQEAGVFFDLALPVGFRRELAGVRNTQLQLAREKARLEDMELNTVHLLTTAIRNMDTSYVLAQTHFNRWSASQKEVESAEALYQGGKTTLDRVLDAQRRRADAQRDFYTALTNYSKAIAEVHFRKGSLLEYNNICLAEGPWPKKAYWDALAKARERDASYYLDYGWTRPDVVSRGPAPTGMGDAAAAGPQAAPLEQIPAPQPTPADAGPVPAPPTPADLDDATPDSLPLPDAPPVTERPAPPVLNAPIIRTGEGNLTAAPVENPLRRSAPAAFAWGSLGLDATEQSQAVRDPAVQPANFQSDTAGAR